MKQIGYFLGNVSTDMSAHPTQKLEANSSVRDVKHKIKTVLMTSGRHRLPGGIAWLGGIH